ncbi:MAG TPA: phosphatase PAP2 family protein [Virgibacillus sp.]|nr:phosphatase PAP2 family protein [Virgibacillus sp.]
MKNKTLFVTIMLSMIIFLTTALVTQMNGSFGFDQSMMNWVEQTSSPLLVNTMDVISLFGSSEVILLLTGLITVIFLFKRDWLNVIFFLVVSVGGVFLNLLLKLAFQRERPDGEVSYIDVFNVSLEIPSYSFPSGHTMRATILLLFLMYLVYTYVIHRSLKGLLLLLCSLGIVGVALSRLFLEAHFLSDTIAAISVSIMWFCLVRLFFKKYDDRGYTKYRSVIGR